MVSDILVLRMGQRVACAIFLYQSKMQNKIKFLTEEKAVAVTLSQNEIEDFIAFLNNVEESLVSLIRKQVYETDEAEQSTIHTWMQTQDQLAAAKDLLSFNHFKPLH